MKIVFLQTGGTIDKDYPRLRGGYAFEITEPAVERVLEKVRPSFEYEIIQVLKKDSSDMTDDDREKILSACLETELDKIVITHGTDTMLDTARKLSSIEEKTIVITGAMRPELFANSDASFNIGTAIGAISVLDRGVYIAMNGRVIRWDSCQRDEKTGQFLEKKAY